MYPIKPIPGPHGVKHTYWYTPGFVKVYVKVVTVLGARGIFRPSSVTVKVCPIGRIETV